MPLDPSRYFEMRPGPGGPKFFPRFRFRDAATPLDFDVNEQVLNRIRRNALRRSRDGFGEALAHGISAGAHAAAAGVEKLNEVHAQAYHEAGIHDQNPDERVVAELPAPPAGYHYEVESRGEKHVVVLEAGEPDLPNLADRRVHRLSGPDPLLKRMNRDAKKLWGQKTTDKENTIFAHAPLPNERLELRGPNERGLYYVVLVSPDEPEIAGRTPKGASGTGPQQSSGSSPPESRTGDRHTTSTKLRTMNAANHAFWDRRR